MHYKKQAETRQAKRAKKRAAGTPQCGPKRYVSYDKLADKCVGCGHECAWCCVLTRKEHSLLTFFHKYLCTRGTGGAEYDQVDAQSCGRCREAAYFTELTIEGLDVIA